MISSQCWSEAYQQWWRRCPADREHHPEGRPCHHTAMPLAVCAALCPEAAHSICNIARPMYSCHFISHQRRHVLRTYTSRLVRKQLTFSWRCTQASAAYDFIKWSTCLYRPTAKEIHPHVILIINLTITAVLQWCNEKLTLKGWGDKGAKYETPKESRTVENWWLEHLGDRPWDRQFCSCQTADVSNVFAQFYVQQYSQKWKIKYNFLKTILFSGVIGTRALVPLGTMPSLSATAEFTFMATHYQRHLVSAYCT